MRKFVYRYKEQTLQLLLRRYGNSKDFIVQNKGHFGYFKEYFRKFPAKTIVVEDEYVDRDFLEDFVAYYVRCFDCPGRFCARLHFFRDPFSQIELLKVLRGNPSRLSVRELKESYLGFIVVKPLPQNMIGRTCLKAYPDEKRRSYPINRDYTVQLYGIDLTISSIAYQEQDTVAAACATSALWSALQVTGFLFHHNIPSPVEITKRASAGGLSPVRDLPSHGLTTEQMAQAIREVGLEPELFGAGNLLDQQSAIYGHIQMVPLLALCLLCVKAKLKGKNCWIPYQGGPYHAITVTGFSLAHPNPISYDETGTLFRASLIDRIYAHDDQVGPFSRLVFADPITVTDPTTLAVDRYHVSMKSSWDDLLGIESRVVPLHFLIPVYHKIRIPLRAVRTKVTKFDLQLEGLKKRKEFSYLKLAIPARFEWDLYLTEINSVKIEWLRENSLSGDLRAPFLLRPMPRYLWRAIARLEGNRVLEVLFDATGIEQGDFVHCVVFHDIKLKQLLTAIAKHPQIAPRLQRDDPWSIWNRIAKGAVMTHGSS